MSSPKFIQIQKILNDLKEPAYRFSNIVDSLFHKNITRFDLLKSLPVATRSKLAAELGPEMLSCRVKKLIPSKQCVKLLLELKDLQTIETVWYVMLNLIVRLRMQFKESHSSVCISSQVGCALKCSFCATGAVGFKRQLTADEIVDQVLVVKAMGKKVDTISFMGMGEAFQNPRTFDALRILTHPDFMGMSQRKISVSTVGIIPGIVRLYKEFPNVNLAVSLHSPFSDQRTLLVPNNRIYPLSELIMVLGQHARIANRKIMLAYLVLVCCDVELFSSNQPGFNDSELHAKELQAIIRSLDASVRHLFQINLLRWEAVLEIRVLFE